MKSLQLKKIAKNLSRLLGGLLAAGFLMGIWSGAAQASSETSLQMPAMKSPLVSHVLLTDSAQLSDHIVAVGLYGTIIYSKDGVSWQQANSPTQMLLTTLFFIDDKEGWAGGHDTLILHTVDGGKNWDIQYEDPITGGDIPKPILDIVFKDKNTGYAIGAYGLMLQTNDGGKSWDTVDTAGLYDLLESMDKEPEPTLSGMISYKGKLLIAGELGTILLFDDTVEESESPWQVIESPYEGSFFGVKQLNSGEVMVYGLRGNIYRSADALQSWDKIETSTIDNIFDCIEMPGDKLIFAGASGTLLRMDKQAMATEKMPYQYFDSLMSLQTIRNNELLIFGSSGVKTVLFD